MLDRKILVLVTLLLVGCEKNCTDDFLSVYGKLQNYYDQLFMNPNQNNANRLKSELNTFVSSFNGVKCKQGKTTLEPTAEVKALLNEMNNGRNSSTKSEVTAKLIYGDDDRLDLTEVTNSQYKEWGRSTLAQVSKTKISSNGSLQAKTLKDRYSLCDGERFANQLTAARCSGFLVGPDILVTAGHCMEDQNDCDDNYWAVDYVKGKTKLTGQELYGCSEIIDQVLDYTTGLDYAVVRLKREVTDRKYFRWRSDSDALKLNQSLLVIGHPSGLPTKVAGGASVKDLSEDHFFKANLDTFAGNSGSAVINANTGVVEGILVRGETDYVAVTGTDGNRCMVVNQCSDSNGCDGSFEEVSRMSSVSGIPFGYSEEGLVRGIIEKRLDKITTLYGIDLYGKVFAEYQISGRAFLNRCGLSLSSDGSNDVEKAIHSCGSSNSLVNTMATYMNKFYF